MFKSNKDKTKIHREITQRSIGYITAGLGLVAGLAWNDAIRSTIEIIFPTNQGTLIAKWVYAVIFTVILVILTIQLTKFLSKLDN